MDFLEAHKASIEQAIYFKLADLLNLDVEIVLYDTTSSHFEIECGVFPLARHLSARQTSVRWQISPSGADLDGGEGP